MTAHVRNRDTEARDWAEKLALEIALDMHRRGTQDACNLTAARLRMVKADGVLEGIARLSDSLKKVRNTP